MLVMDLGFKGGSHTHTQINNNNKNYLGNINLAFWNSWEKCFKSELISCMLSFPLPEMTQEAPGLLYLHP